MMPLPSLSTFLITLSITVCGLLALKSKESRSHEKIATLRPIPGAFGLAQATFAGGGAGVACGTAALFAPAICDHAELDASSETTPAKINPVAIRILFPLDLTRAAARLSLLF